MPRDLLEGQDLLTRPPRDLLEGIETQQPAKPTIAGVPRYAEVEREISQRRNPFEVLWEELTYKPENRWGIGQAVRPLTAVAKAFDIPRRIVESPLASAGLAYQRGGLKELLTPQAGKEILQGITGERVAEAGDIPYAAGIPKPISSAIGLLTMAGLAKPSAVKNVVTHPIKSMQQARDEIQALGKGASDIVRNVSTKFKGFIHGKEWIKTQARSVKDVSEKLDDSLGNLYQSFYKTQGIGDVELDPDIMLNILKKHNVPEALINEIAEQAAGMDNIHKAQAALQILGKRVNDPIWQGVGKGAEFNPKIAAKNSWIEIKRYMREAASKVNPEAAKRLEELDGLAHDKIYPTINKFRSIAGKEVKPKTSTIYDIFAGGVKKAAEQEYIEEAPENIQKMSKYLDSPEFQQEISEVFKTADSLAKSMKSFTRRQLQKKVGLGVLTGGGIYGLGRKFTE